MPPDHYAALDVAPDADTATIRAAYLDVMRAHHPDRRPGDTEAIARVLQANAAWEVLRDRGRRDRYDRQRRPWSPAAPGADGGDGVVRLVAPPPRAYSPDQERYRRQFSGALLRVALVLLAVGTVLLLALPPR